MAYSPDGKWKNPWVKLTKEEFKRDTGRVDYVKSLENNAAYDPSKDSGERMTGYHAKETDPFGANAFMSDISETHNTNFINNDPLASAVSQYVVQDSATGANVLSDDLYGKLDYGPECKSFVEMGVGLVGSVMDQFTGIQEACAYNPSGYAANGFGNTEGAFKGWKSAGSEERRDHYGNIIKTEGLQDYVEEGGRRYNLDFAGNRTETDAFGNALAANNDVSGFYAAAGWNSDSGGWNTSSAQSFYGIAESSSIYGAPTKVADAGSIYDTSNIWGNTVQVAAADTSWFFADNTKATADQQRRDDYYWGNSKTDYA